ncbi:hypothetical protein [Micromonospora chokoriensis]|uniref:Uncharacterized protein n=1 Tax=Micromonospora chokoriensis TaxID=356851 RepID=A0A1C4ULW8_9ACTN|nr:hypothetical protein [Micromonospora chokoriensis]SCE72689.1 hypothetical protein GA0070612_0554 [Micromonospora chokoriensis]
MTDPGEPTIEIRMTTDEALVMSDWIWRLQRSKAKLEDPALWMPLYRIGGSIEGALVEIFHPDYEERVAAARKRLLIQLNVDENGRQLDE